MELSALAGNAHVKAVLSQQEGAGACPTPISSPARRGWGGIPWPGCCAGLCCVLTPAGSVPAATVPPAGRCPPASTRM